MVVGVGGGARAVVVFGRPQAAARPHTSGTAASAPFHAV